MALQHLKLRENGPKDRLTFTILGRTGARFAEALAHLVSSHATLKTLRPEVRSSVLEIDPCDHLPGATEALDQVVGQALEIASHDKEIAAQVRQMEESQRIDIVRKFTEDE